MSLAQLANIAVNYSRAMDAISAQAADPTLIQDPARVAMFQQQLNYAQSAFTLTSRTMQDMHQEDKILGEMLRDA